MRLSRGRIIAIGLVVLAVLGFIFLRGPTPHVVIKAEELWSVGPIDITNTMFSSWFVVIIIIGLVFFGTRRRDLVPRGFQNFFEAALEAFYNLVVTVAGEKNGRRFFVVVATIFFYVLIANWFSLFPIFNVWGPFHAEDEGFVMEQTQVAGLDVAWVPFSGFGSLSGDSIDGGDPDHLQQAEQARAEGKAVGEVFPLFRGPNTDLNTPLALALVSFVAVATWGISSLGLRIYLSEFFRFGGILRGVARFNFGLIFAGVIDAFVGLLELVSVLVRMVSFTFRLFGNMFAGEVVILMFTFLTPLVFTLAFYGLELFVGLIQAFIFAILTLVFGMMAVAHAEAHGESHEEESHTTEEQTREAGAVTAQTHG